MKALKNLGYVLLLVLLGMALVGLYLPGEVSVERRLTMAATPATLFPLLGDPQALARWAPWATPGTEVRYAFEGPSSGIGSSLHWEGGALPLGSGTATVTQVEQGRRVEMRMDVPLLGKIHSALELSGEPESGSTDVSWRLYDDVGFNLPRRLLWLLADPAIGSQLERGLDNLRGLAEHR